MADAPQNPPPDEKQPPPGEATPASGETAAPPGEMAPPPGPTAPPETPRRPDLSRIPDYLLDDAEDDDVEPLVFSAPLRYALIWAGIIVPGICFLGAAHRSEGLSPSAPFSDVAGSMLAGWSLLPPLPLVLYSMGCLGQLLHEPAHYARKLSVRFGIYTGVIYGLEYSVLYAIALHGTKTVFAVRQFAAVLPGVLILVIVMGFIVVIPARIGKMARNPVVAGFFSAVNVPTALLGLVPALILSAIFAPWLALPAYAWPAVKLVRWQRARGEPFRFSLAGLCGFVLWWSVHMALWRVAYVLTQG